MKEHDLQGHDATKQFKQISAIVVMTFQNLALLSETLVCAVKISQRMTILAATLDGVRTLHIKPKLEAEGSSSLSNINLQCPPLLPQI